MLQQLDDCPKPETLADFLLGNLTPTELETCEQHLASCDPCVDTIRDLKADDTLSGLARNAMLAKKSVAPESTDSEMELVEQLIVKMETMPHSSHSLSSNDQQRSIAGRSAEVQRLLSAPLEADDIGALGEYRLLRLLGAGSTGVVYQAVDQRLQRMVALKILRPSLGEAARERFVAEARATAAIEHPNVVTIYEVGPEGPLSYIAMQWLPGQTLEEKLCESEVLPLDEVRQLAIQIAKGLAAAHEQGLIHRDIKPANIWIPADGSGAKILDFGLVRIADEDPQLTCTGMIAGTPCYMSPEQSRGQTLDQRSDLFSLGCLVYQSLLGRLPFRSDNALATLQSIQRDQPTPPVELDPAIPADISDLVMCLLAKTPNRRPPSASAVVQALNSSRTNWTFDSSSADQAAKIGISPSSGRDDRSVRWWKTLTATMALLTLGTIGFAGAMWGDQITRIVTNQGVIEIVTTVDDIEIDVVETQSGKVVTIDSGAGRIDVKAGQYTIRPSADTDQDSVLIQNNQLTLSRGGKAIVVVTRQDSSSETPTSSDETPYLLDSGDTLGIYIEGVIGKVNSDPPINTPPTGSLLPPAIGFPFQVESSGTISLPSIEPVQARGKTLEQFKQAIVDAYTEGDDPILKSDQLRIYVSMIQQRDYERREMLRQSKNIPAKVPTSGNETTYLLDAGDILRIAFNGRFNSSYDVGSDETYEVEANGTISLPLIEPVQVRGKTLGQVRQAIFDAYTTGDTPILEGVGIKVSMIQRRDYEPREMLRRSKSSPAEKERRDHRFMPGFRQAKPDSSNETTYLLDAGDTLDIVIDGIVHTPSDGLRPFLGAPFKVQVESNGTISLPFVEPVQAKGTTAEQVKQSIVDAYTEGDDPILKPEPLRIDVRMIQQRGISPAEKPVSGNETPYLLDAGDTLGIYIGGIIGKYDSDPPIHTPPAGSLLPPAIGFPFQVEADGTISLPNIEPVRAKGKTLKQFKQAIVDAYTEGDDPILIPERARIYVSMIQQHDYEQREMLRRSILSMDPQRTINRNPTRSQRGGRTLDRIFKRAHERHEDAGYEGTRPVTGIVTMDGVPLANVAITFYPVEGGRANSTSNTNELGEYALRDTNKAKGLIPGQYKVGISKTKKIDSDETVETLPQRFNRKSELFVEVRGSGDNVLNFELTSENKNSTTVD